MAVDHAEHRIEHVLVGHKPNPNQLCLGCLGNGMLCKEQKQSIFATDKLMLIYKAVSYITDITVACLFLKDLL